MTDPTTRSTIANVELLGSLQRHAGTLFRNCTGWLTWLYAFSLLLLLAWLEWCGEHLALTGALLFAPPLVLLLPVLVLGPFCLIIRPRLIVVHMALMALVVFGYMGFRWTPSRPPQDREIRLVTHNAGQGNRTQFYDFVAAERADIVALQDARGRGVELSKKYPGQHIVGRGEFQLVSRFPIVQSEFIEQAKWLGRPVAARFELLCRDQALVIYNVHLPTPRQQLNRFLSGRALADMFVEEDRTRRPPPYGEWTRARLQLANDLAGVISRETLPFLVCGDLNTPDHGVIYHTVTRDLTDAHLHGGRGWGFTFPGTTGSLFSLREPWLRIDFALAGRGWKPLECRREPGRRSQHCAVLARFVPKP